MTIQLDRNMWQNYNNKRILMDWYQLICYEFAVLTVYDDATNYRTDSQFILPTEILFTGITFTEIPIDCSEHQATNLDHIHLWAKTNMGQREHQVINISTFQPKAFYV
jgi:hypothetical protein